MLIILGSKTLNTEHLLSIEVGKVLRNGEDVPAVKAWFRCALKYEPANTTLGVFKSLSQAEAYKRAVDSELIRLGLGQRIEVNESKTGRMA